MAHGYDYDDHNETVKLYRSLGYDVPPGALRKERSFVSAKDDGSINESDIDNNTEDGSAESAIAISQRGELPEFLSYITLLLDNSQHRRMLYIILLSIWLLPLSVQTFDVISKHSELTYNSLCVNQFTCYLTFVGFTLITFSLILQFIIIYTQSQVEYKNPLRFAYVLLLGGFLALFSVVILITFAIEKDYESKTNSPRTTCFHLNQTRGFEKGDERYCRVSYFGNNLLGLTLTLLLFFDYLMEKRHFKVRVILMGSGMVIAAVCIGINLIINNKYYINEHTGVPLTRSCFGVCVGGYLLTVIAIGVLIPILMVCRLKYRYRRKIGKLCSALLIFGLFGVQVRTYTQHWLFTISGLIFFVDIQVLSEQS